MFAEGLDLDDDACTGTIRIEINDTLAERSEIWRIDVVGNVQGDPDNWKHRRNVGAGGAVLQRIECCPKLLMAA